MTSRDHSRWYLGIILVISTSLAICYNVLQPIWEAPDEPAHFGYIRFLQLQNQLPRAITGIHAFNQPWNTTNEYSQAPLYYIVEAIALKAVPLLPDAQPHLNPRVAWPGDPLREAVALHRTDESWPYSGLSLFVHAGRLVGTLFGVITLLATYSLVLTVTKRVGAALFATAWLAFSPVFLLTDSRLDNDAAAMATGSVALALCAGALVSPKRSSPLRLLFLSLGLTAALLSKLDTAFLIPLVAVAAGISADPAHSWNRHLARRMVVAAAILAIPLSTFAAWWLTYARSSAEVLGVKAGFGVLEPWTVIAGIDGGRALNAFWNWNATWWGGVGWGTLTLWPPLVYIALAIPMVGFTGLGLLSLRQARTGDETSRRREIVTIILVLSVIPIFYATVARAAVPAIGLDSNARFTLPAAPVIALLVAQGLTHPILSRIRRWAPQAYGTALIGLAVATAVVLLPRIPRPEIPSRLAVNVEETSRQPRVAFQNGIDLLSIGGLPSSLVPGRQLPIDLTWRVNVPVERSFTAFAQIIDVKDRRVVAASDAIPYAESFPPEAWQKLEIVDEHRTLTPPATLPPGQYVLLVGTYYLNGNEISPIPIVGSSPPANSAELMHWQVLPDAADLSTAKPTTAVFGSNIQLPGYSVETTGTSTTVTLFWLGTRPVPEDYVVSVQALGADGRPMSQNDSEPVDGRIPTSTWPPGRIVRDVHVLAVPVGSTVDRLIVVVYNRQSLQRLPVSEPGSPLADYLTLGR
jgi:hypothetical protein